MSSDLLGGLFYPVASFAPLSPIFIVYQKKFIIHSIYLQLN